MKDIEIMTRLRPATKRDYGEQVKITIMIAIMIMIMITITIKNFIDRDLLVTEIDHPQRLCSRSFKGFGFHQFDLHMDA